MIGDEPPRQRAIVGLPVLLRARVANYAKDEPAEITVKAIVSDQEVARSSLTLKPEEQKVADLTFVPKDSGFLKGRFEIQTDRFPDDDTYFFTLSVLPQVKVVLLNGSPNVDAFENEALYVRTALSSGVFDEDETDGKGGKLAKDSAYYRSLARSMDVREIPEPSLTPDALRDAGVLVLANCGQLNAQHFAWIRSYVADGGGLIIFPGDLVKRDLYNDQFFPAPGPQKEAITQARLETPLGDPLKAGTFERFAALDFRHPVLAAFDNPEAKYLSTIRFYRHFPLTMPEKRGNAWSLARFSSGSPAIVESRLGKGIVILAAFPVNAKWSNLPLKPEFVPLILRLVNYAQRRPELDVPLVASAEGVTEIAVSPEWAPATGAVVSEAGVSNALAFRRSDVRLVGAFDQAKKKGYYRVDIKGGSAAKAKSGTALFAVNIAPEESNFSAVTESDLREMMPQASVTLVDASAEAQQLYGNVGDEQEVWQPMIWLIFAIIGVEFMIATFSGTRRKKTERGQLARRLEHIFPESWRGWLAGRPWRGVTASRSGEAAG